jgi:hypothetical protein
MTDAEWWQDFWNGISAVATLGATGVALFFGIRASRREAADRDAKRQQIARAANILLKDAVDAVDILVAKIGTGPIPFFPAAEVAFAKEKIEELRTAQAPDKPSDGSAPTGALSPSQLEQLGAQDTIRRYQQAESLARLASPLL